MVFSFGWGLNKVNAQRATKDSSAFSRIAAWISRREIPHPVVVGPYRGFDTGA